jgi:hypothetical protein
MTVERPMFPPRGAAMNNVVKFPFGVSHKAPARKPRASKNGPPEETPTEVVHLDNRPPAGSLSTTAENGVFAKSAMKFGYWPRQRRVIGECD